MMQTRSLILHHDGPALWPQHKPLAEVMELRDTTPPLIWEGTYQGSPTPPGGHTFKRAWWLHTRYSMADHLSQPPQNVLERYQAWDTASKDDVDNAFTVCTTGELMADYTLRITRVWRDRLETPYLPAEVLQQADQANQDGKLRGVVIEDKGSGIGLLQTLRLDAPVWLAAMLVAYLPTIDKVGRADQAAIWCKNGSVWLPQPSMQNLWLVDFEDEIFNFPQSAFMDQADSFAMLVIYLENLLSTGLHARAYMAGQRDEHSVYAGASAGGQRR